jgi:hypothetical protein
VWQKLDQDQDLKESCAVSLFMNGGYVGTLHAILLCAAPWNSNSLLWFVLLQRVRVLAKAIAVVINSDLRILVSLHLAFVIMNFDDMMSQLKVSANPKGATSPDEHVSIPKIRIPTICQCSTGTG